LCPECGKYYEGQLKFCPNCGYEINKPKSVPKPTPKASARLCPKCGLPIEIKVANKGAQQGKSFYVCPNYKQCQQVFPVE
jgi:ssDNA-binding Zn-finger/Zn-ribbon topoisomerase 1